MTEPIVRAERAADASSASDEEILRIKADVRRQGLAVTTNTHNNSESLEVGPALRRYDG